MIDETPDAQAEALNERAGGGGNPRHERSRRRAGCGHHDRRWGDKRSAPCRHRRSSGHSRGCERKRVTRSRAMARNGPNAVDSGTVSEGRAYMRVRQKRGAANPMDKQNSCFSTASACTSTTLLIEKHLLKRPLYQHRCVRLERAVDLARFLLPSDVRLEKRKRNGARPIWTNQYTFSSLTLHSRRR